MGKKVKKEVDNPAMAMMTPEQQALMQQVMIMMQAQQQCQPLGKPSPAKKKAPSKKKKAGEEENNDQEQDEYEETPMLPGQKVRPPPEVNHSLSFFTVAQGDGTRIFYESLL